MNKSIKKILKYGIIFFLIGVTFYISNELFIRNWRIELSEIRVKKSIKLNFQKNEQKIKELKEFLWKLDLKPETTIEFYNGNIIQGYNFNENSLSFSLEPDEDDIENEELTKFVEYIGISEYELKSLGNQIEKINCEAVSIHKDKSISLTYEGFSLLYQCEYYFANNIGKSRRNHEKLDEGIYSGIYDSGMFCGWLIFSK